MHHRNENSRLPAVLRHLPASVLTPRVRNLSTIQVAVGVYRLFERYCVAQTNMLTM